MFGYPREHAWTNFFPVMEGENKIWPARARKNAMGADYTFSAPTASRECVEQAASLDAGPLAHA